MRISRLLPPPATLLVAAFAGVGLTGLGLAYSDYLVESRFAAAMRSMPQPAGALAPHSDKAPAVAGTEEYWLGHRLPDGAAPVAYAPRTWAVGVRLAMDAGGVARHLEVTQVSELHGDAAKAVGDGRQHMLVVACRDVDHPERAPLRLVVDADEAVPAARSASNL